MAANLVGGGKVETIGDCVLLVPTDWCPAGLECLKATNCDARYR